MTTTINADNGVVSGSAGLKETSDSSGILALQTNGVTAVTLDASQNVNFSGTAQRITGDFSNATLANRVMFQTSTVNGNTIIGAMPNGTATASAFTAFNAADPGNASRLSLQAVTTETQLVSTFSGTGTYLPMTFYTGGSERMRIDTSGDTTFTGNVVGVLKSGTAVASTSGTSVTFTGIPSTASRITVMLRGVSISGTSGILVQIGSGSIQTTGYVSTSINVNNAAGTSGGGSTAGFYIFTNSASDTNSGLMTIANISGDIWVESHTTKRITTAAVFGGGDVALSGTLDRVRIITLNGTDTFDAGTINIMWE